MAWIPARGTYQAARRAPGGRGIGGAGWALALLAALALIGGCASPTTRHSAPTATPTAQQRIAALAARAIGAESQHATVTAVFGAPSAGTPATGTTPESSGTADMSVVTVTVTLKGKVPGPQEIGATQERVKTICFQVQRALWTSSPPLSAVTISVVGPIYDDYADITTASYGAAVLKAPAAATLDWASLNPDAAWAVYGIWLRPDYQPKVVGQYGG